MESLKWQLKQNASALVWKGQQPTGAPLSAPGWSRWRPVITRRSSLTALINLEHIKGYTPDSPFRRFGTVDKLEAEEIADGPLKGKMALYAWITPSADLVAYTRKLQKLFTSMEVNTSFADTGKAYLVGLAATDDPASLGTEMLQFSASAKSNPLAGRKQSPENLFTAAEETLIEWEEVQGEKTSLFLPASPRCLPKKSKPMMRVFFLMCIVPLSWSPPSSRT